MAEEPDAMGEAYQAAFESSLPDWHAALELERLMVKGCFVALNIDPRCLPMLESIREYCLQGNPAGFTTLGKTLEEIILSIHRTLVEGDRPVDPG